MNKQQIKSIDRYSATGTPSPTEDSCSECEAMGIYPQHKSTLNEDAVKSPTGRLLVIGQVGAEEDDYVFVQCPYCNGTRKKQ